MFRDDADRRSFLAQILLCVERYRWTVHALCLMTTHYHLVLHATQPELSRGLQRPLGRYAQSFNQRHGRFGPLFAGRFTARAIEGEDYLRAACRYVVESPVRPGFATRSETGPGHTAATRPAPRQGPGLRATYQPTSMS